MARLVDGVTKLSKFGARSHEEQQAENIRKMLLAMAEDIRVVLIKLADRLHNMRTIAALPPEKQQRIARQTAEIYAPLAERLGIWQIKWELEDLSFKVLEPEEYQPAGRAARDRTARSARPTSSAPWPCSTTRSSKAGITAEHLGPAEAHHSIWKKMQRKGANLDEIYDVHAVRVLVDEVRDCYAALGVVHSTVAADPGPVRRLHRDAQGATCYQSLHTAVIALDGKPLEVQIRTHEMHRVSEIGIAAHWRYKEGGKVDRDYDAKLAWVRQLMDWQRDVSRRDRVRRRRQARHLPGPGLRVHAQGRRQGPARRLDAARLRLPHPHRRRPLVRSAPRSTTASCRSTTSSRTATSSRSSPPRPPTGRRATG